MSAPAPGLLLEDLVARDSAGASASSPPDCAVLAAPPPARTLPPAHPPSLSRWTLACRLVAGAGAYTTLPQSARPTAHVDRGQQGASVPGTGIGADVLCPPDALPPPGSCSLAILACRAAANVLVPAPVCSPVSAGGAAVPLLLLLGGAGASVGLLTVLGMSDAATTLPASAWCKNEE